MQEMWKYHDQKMKELKQTYNKISKQTQNRMQEIFDSINFTFEDMYKIANNSLKERINFYIEEWKDKGLLKGTFGKLARNIYKRTRVQNSEILELLIYSAYIEEQKKLDEIETITFKEEANYYYQEGEKEVNNTTPKKRRISIIPEVVLMSLLSIPTAAGYVWKDYIEDITKYNAQQIYRQVIIDLQQQRELDITNDIYQNLIKKQQNARLNIKENKISGNIDLFLIGLNNQAKVEGIYSFDRNAKIKFIAVEDNVTTQMCKSLDGQIFKVHNWNEFCRYSKTNDTIKKYRCYGLIPGLNLPPINDGFHWCRSSVIYQVEKEEETEYNLDIPKISKEVVKLLGNTKLNNKVRKLFDKYLTKENTIIDTNNLKPMYYSEDKDKIIINPKHSEFKYYDLQESLSHEIIHMIDIRNNISNKLSIDNELRRARLSIDIDEDKFINMLNMSKYEDNMALGDIFSALTNGKIKNNFGHDSRYWLKDTTRVEKELSANIMSAYLTNNKEAIEIIDSIKGLKKIKEKVVKEYGLYTA